MRQIRGPARDTKGGHEVINSLRHALNPANHRGVPPFMVKLTYPGFFAVHSLAANLKAIVCLKQGGDSLAQVVNDKYPHLDDCRESPMLSDIVEQQ